jgi:hypothetical protein
MQALHVTNHGQMRMRQRGLSADDLGLLLQVGVDVPDGYFVTRKGCAKLIRHLKQIIGRLERLPGRKAIVRGNALVTAYHASKAQQRQLAAQAEEREFR